MTRRLGPFQLLHEIGQGGMSTVYAAVPELLRRPAAVKVLLPAFSVNQDMVDRFPTKRAPPPPSRPPDNAP